jgi:organic hydroperoxide reductase OsmC/OhrA
MKGNCVMSQHTVHIAWRRQAHEPFTDNRYSRAHAWHFDGGAEVRASSAPSAVRPPMSDPAAVDPEEALVAALSSCHMLWFLALAAKQGFVVDDYADDAVGIMQRSSEGRMAMTRVTLRPMVRWSGERQPSPDELAALHHKAHDECYIANSVKTEVGIEPQPAP